MTGLAHGESGGILPDIFAWFDGPSRFPGNPRPGHGGKPSPGPRRGNSPVPVPVPRKLPGESQTRL
jgi:hypothetical protein